MTAPLTFPAPYSLTATTTNNSTLFDGTTSGYHRLPVGVHTLLVSWDGTNRLDIFLSPQADYRTRVLVKSIPEGTGLRSVIVPGIGVYKNIQKFLSFAASGTGNVAVSLTTIPLAP